MGCGKSTIGKKLANKLGLSFVDMDREIEQAQKKSIAHIFKEFGEEHFRKLESDWLQSCQRTNVVISTGGGTPCFNNNMQTMNSKGTTVFLHVSSGILAQRLFKPGQNRPLLSNYVQDQKTLQQYIDTKLNERLKYYDMANITIDASSMDSHQLNELANKILALH